MAQKPYSRDFPAIQHRRAQIFLDTMFEQASNSRHDAETESRPDLQSMASVGSRKASLCPVRRFLQGELAGDGGGGGGVELGAPRRLPFALDPDPAS